MNTKRERLKTFRSNGFDCEIIKQPGGFLCGYVIISRGHPWFETHYDDVNAVVHGGLTYSGYGGDDRWRVGFDCGHLSMDIVPSSPVNFPDAVYRDVNYVVGELDLLTQQALDASKDPKDETYRA